MTNREKYDIKQLDSVINGPYAMIYYRPKHSTEIISLVGIVFQQDNEESISDSIVRWLDSEATGTLAVYPVDCF